MHALMCSSDPWNRTVAPTLEPLLVSIAKIWASLGETESFPHSSPKSPTPSPQLPLTPSPAGVSFRSFCLFCLTHSLHHLLFSDTFPELPFPSLDNKGPKDSSHLSFALVPLQGRCSCDDPAWQTRACLAFTQGAPILLAFFQSAPPGWEGLGV